MERVYARRDDEREGRLTPALSFTPGDEPQLGAAGRILAPPLAARAVVVAQLVSVGVVRHGALAELRSVLDLLLRTVDVDALLVAVDPVDDAGRDDHLAPEDPRACVHHDRRRSDFLGRLVDLADSPVERLDRVPDDSAYVADGDAVRPDVLLGAHHCLLVVCRVRYPRGLSANAAPNASSTLRFVDFTSIDELEQALRDAEYLPDRGLSTALYLSLALSKPVLLEGEAGVGKTEAAKALATVLKARLIRLQCYEGLDVAHAVYEWNYPRQLLHIRAAQEGTVSEDELFGPEYLIRRPLLEAIDSEDPVVLLIDEIDRADEEFEAFLLEVLSDFQITIPEIGTITARRRPAVILTSNRTRELHDALKRRALFHWIGHPSIEREIEIVRLRVPGIPGRLAAEAAGFVRGLRGLDLAKPPGVAETIDWAMALNALGRQELDAEVVEQTLGSVLKYREDIDAVRDETLARLVDEARAAAAT
jgi:MoxR-like ATPase